ncbi:hypothetical protein SS1G_02814 [Sclerotinia sclerotiorum 1980 UF-70]|uniref:Glycoside hydrolase family 3 C-terminal domain-containing protein n=2 Tax=Sclerotinia sclerotiorum (strain ATCC 18683 / 1980 / Ss-1) TaxID=665079 RepID=A7EBX8_SCLS1|nr:hypothetical protein SS1G_02814 [Sclerotinia sclerotiorum 1980 UF-70]APA08965.1 hypothetical protein sscle_04g037350 [Sclerotinia sclerotiorum 1980 UF-70]EDN99956.1 hypothetical protein SS1G_02814 [Sclerotinia sclerotiorum 1980 UF-70]
MQGYVSSITWWTIQNVTAIFYAHLADKESERVVVSLLYNDENFSGKLHYTVARNESDLFPQSDFSEGSLLTVEHLIEKTSLPGTSLDLAFRTLNSTFQIWSLRMSIQEQRFLPNWPYQTWWLRTQDVDNEQPGGLPAIFRNSRCASQATPRFRESEYQNRQYKDI